MNDHTEANTKWFYRNIPSESSRILARHRRLLTSLVYDLVSVPLFSFIYLLFFSSLIESDRAQHRVLANIYSIGKLKRFLIYLFIFLKPSHSKSKIIIRSNFTSIYSDKWGRKKTSFYPIIHVLCIRLHFSISRTLLYPACFCFRLLNSLKVDLSTFVGAPPWSRVFRGEHLE